MILVDNRHKNVSKPVFSVITAVLNAEQTIEDTILSVLNQTFREFEFIIVDGGSTDGTLSRIEKFSDQIDLCISEQDRGLYFAFNKGIELAQGHYIGILNSDDSYYEYTLSLVWKSIQEAKDAECILYGGVTVSNGVSHETFFHHLNIRNAMISHPATFVKSSVYKAIGSFDTKFKVAADYDFIARSFLAGISFIPIQRSLARYRPGGYSDKHWVRSIKETVQVRSKLNEWNTFEECWIFIRIYLASCARRITFAFKNILEK